MSRSNQSGASSRCGNRRPGHASSSFGFFATTRHKALYLFRNESGQVTPIMGLVLATFLFGFISVAIDGGNLMHKRRLAQAAADAAAVAAAEEAIAQAGTTAEQNAANAMAKLNGFDTTLAKNPATATISTPTSGNYAGSSSYIQVVVSQPISTYFAGVIKLGPTITVSGRGVSAANQTAPTCICLEGTSGMDLNMSNNAKLTATGCGVTANSNSSNAAQIIGSAKVTATSIGSVSTNWYPGGVNNGGSVGTGTAIVQGITSKCAPPLPTIPTYTSSSCTSDPLTHFGNGGSTYSVGPGSTYSTTQAGTLVCYNSLTVGSNGDAVTLNPGIYVINGGSLHFLSGANNASNKGGNGVFFYLLGNASLTIDNGANVNLTASTSGTYAGTLIYQDAADTNALSIQGGSNTSFSGAIFASGAAVTLGNGSGTSINADIAAKSLTMNGGGTLNSSPIAGFGTYSPTVAKVTE